MNPANEPRRTRRRSDVNIHYSAFSITTTPVSTQRSSAKLEIEGQKYKETITIDTTKDCESKMKSSLDDKTKTRRHSLGALNPACSPRSVTLPVPYGTRRQNGELSPFSFRVLRQVEAEMEKNERKRHVNRLKSDENGKQSREQAVEKSMTTARNTNHSQKANAKMYRSTKLNNEEERSNLNRRIQMFNQNMEAFNQTKVQCRKISLERPNKNSTNNDSPRSMSLPLIFQSYADQTFARLSPSEKNSYESLRHCRYLRIPAPPELSIKEIFQQESKKTMNDNN